MEGGDTALIRAARYDHTAIVEALLDAGADMKVQNRVGGCSVPVCHALRKLSDQ